MNRKEIHKICKELGILMLGTSSYNINKKDMSIDIVHNCIIKWKYLTKLPLKFNKINGKFDCTGNKLNTLEWCPKIVNGNFYCSYNYLKSLEHLPNYIEGSIDCRANDIKNFKGVPENFNGEFLCNFNPIFEIYKLFKENSRCIYWINEYDVIRGDNVILDRLEEVFHQLEMRVPDIKEIRGYNLI